MGQNMNPFSTDQKAGYQIAEIFPEDVFFNHFFHAPSTLKGAVWLTSTDTFLASCKLVKYHIEQRTLRMFSVAKVLQHPLYTKTLF